VEITAIRLFKTYGNGTKALLGVDFHLKSSGIFSLIGKNGAGKTTLVRILSTQLLPTSGEAYIDGLEVTRDTNRIRELIAAVPQEARAVPWMTPLQTVTSYLMYRGYRHSDAMERAKDTLRELGLERQENVKNRNLSGGQKRKVLVATSLSSEATLIFMDEPTTGLDFISRKELWKILSDMKRKRFIVLTTHYLEEAEQLGDMVGIMDKGKMVAFGNLDELRGLVRFPVSLRIYSREIEIPDGITQIEHLNDREIVVHTTEDEAYTLAGKLLQSKVKFTVEEASLNTIFSFLASGGDNGD